VVPSLQCYLTRELFRGCALLFARTSSHPVHPAPERQTKPQQQEYYTKLHSTAAHLIPFTRNSRGLPVKSNLLSPLLLASPAVSSSPAPGSNPFAVEIPSRNTGKQRPRREPGHHRHERGRSPRQSTPPSRKRSPSTPIWAQEGERRRRKRSLSSPLFHWANR
jgi:uncharacterized Zn-finger protein